MAAPPITERHLPHFHRRAPMLEKVRAATTANITIATALNNGDTLDGLTLATGDRVLVKDQSTGSQNGIYVVGVTPVRDYDVSTVDPAFGYLVYVIAGTANAATLWKNTNTTQPTIDTTSLTFVQITSTGLTDPMTTRGDIIVRDASNVTARLAIGSNGKVLQSDGTDISWQTPSSGFTNPMTTKGDLIIGDTGGSAIRLAVGTDGQVVTADAASTGGIKWAAAAGATDPVTSVFGAADTAYEFDTSSLTGLTAIGSPTTENANTTIASCLYYKDSTSSTAWMGRYQASPATPFTAITKVMDGTFSVNYNEAALIVGVANPATGAFVTCAIAFNTNRKINSEKFTNRTTFSATIAGGADWPQLPAYLGMVVNSTTSIDYYYSFNGWLWRKFVSANNPSLTVGSVGLAMKSENSGGAVIAFDYLRIWNSAKTFPSA